jgi:hypothetical protein
MQDEVDAVADEVRVRFRVRDSLDTLGLGLER